MRRVVPAAVAAALAACIATIASAEPVNVLERVRGDVGYHLPGERSAYRGLTGSIALPDDARAMTGRRAAARLTLPDSSVVDIGDNTDATIGAFRDDPSRPNGIALQRGALRFTIRHPRGARSNYVFTTPTAQIAVRGTLAYLVSGPNGDQLYCVECAAGDVTVSAANETYRVESGQTLNVRRVGGRAFDAAIVPNATVNNPAIDQFLHGFSPFGRPAAEGSDPTGSNSGG